MRIKLIKAASLVATCVVLFALVDRVIGIPFIPMDLPFSSYQWRWNLPSVRLRMLTDVKRLIQGKSPDEVVALLGSPRHSSNYWWYDLGYHGAGEPPRIHSNRRYQDAGLLVHFDGRAAVGVQGNGDWPHSIQEEPFESLEWKSRTPERRLAMAPFLANSNLLVGKNDESVETLLGPPDEHDHVFLYPAGRATSVQVSFDRHQHVDGVYVGS